MHTSTPFATSPTLLRPRPPVTKPLQLTVIEKKTGRRVCSFPSRLDISMETQHLEFEEEAWRRAVLAQRVDPHARHRYSVELS